MDFIITDLYKPADRELFKAAIENGEELYNFFPLVICRFYPKLYGHYPRLCYCFFLLRNNAGGRGYCIILPAPAARRPPAHRKQSRQQERTESRSNGRPRCLPPAIQLPMMLTIGRTKGLQADETHWMHPAGNGTYTGFPLS